MKNLTPEQRVKLLPKNTVLAGYRGSIVHNMYVPNTDENSTDDIDLMNIYMAPKEYYVGLGRGRRYRKGCDRFVGDYDIVDYEFKHFVNLLLKANPNVLGMLWLNDVHYTNCHSYGQRLIDNRDLFTSKQAYKSFTGYAYGQLKKMTKYSKEGYMGEKRAALVKKFGFDCKNAAHCIRLLKMGMEFLITGELNVFRADASMLLDIKTGKWTLEEVKAEAKRLMDLTEEAYIRSTLPPKPDLVKIEELVVDITMDYVNIGCVYDYSDIQSITVGGRLKDDNTDYEKMNRVIHL